jgi:hypothetical protein
MNTEPIIIVIFSVNLVLKAMQEDIITFLKTTTVDAPMLAKSPEDCRAFRIDTGTRNALPTHCTHIRASK